MVKSNCIKAFIMKNRVFDQSIVGIFPKDETKLNYILALLNSDIINQLIHIINPTANNSANYIKLIPYIEPSKDEINQVDAFVDEISCSIEKNDFEKTEKLHKKLNSLVADIYLGADIFR